MSSPQETRKHPWWLSMNMVGAILLAGAFAISMYRVSSIQKELFSSDEIILRIMHWQLESGYRDSLQSVIDDYQKLQAEKGKRVRILQMAVTERLYGQVLNTSLISGQAPDLALLGMQSLSTNDQYIVRYFVPMTQLIARPNPYNKGTELENVPWRDTFFDGMRGQYNTRLQDYFGVPTAAYNVRLFYNKNMFREATGSDAPPETFGQLMEVCRKVDELAKKKNRLIIPIAGSQYSINFFRDQYSTAFTAGMEKDLDTDLDSYISQQEIYSGFMRGVLSMDMPEMVALHELLRELSAEFGKGFSGKDRQTAAFEFVQQRAAMICTGSWDAKSLFLQAEATGFDVGIFEFPLPAKNEKYGQFIHGKLTEAASASAGAFGLYKFSRNLDQSLDFLQYLSSRSVNQKMMQGAEWIPVVLGTEPTGRMAPFAPNPIGFTACVRPYYGGDVDSKYKGELWSFLQGEQPYSKYAKAVEDALRNPDYGGDRAWTLEWDDLVKQVRNQDRAIATQVVAELMLGTPTAQMKQRQLLLQQVRLNNAEGHRYRFQQVRGFALPEK